MTTNYKIREAIGELDTHFNSWRFDGSFSIGHLSNALSILRSILNDTASLDDEGREMFDTLWNGYPKQQWDGQSAPARSKTVCLDRFPKACKKHGVTPEQCVKAIAAYVRSCRENKQYIKGLETILKTQPVWVDYLEK